MSIPKEGSRDTGQGIIVSLTPDVCKTPVGSSLVPIPYSVVAYQSDDANTASTVRMTKMRAHKYASVVTKTIGDQPSSAGGVKSGTTGAACHPRTHSGTVNIEGSPAIRHTDEWWMNNRNTVGKLTWVKSTETFAPTHAIALSRDPQLEAPGPALMSSWRVHPRQGEAPILLAQAPATVLSDVAPMPSTPSANPPFSNPDTAAPRNPGTPANDNARPPNRVANQTAVRPAPSAAAASRVLGMLGLAQMGFAVGDMAGQWYVGPDAVFARQLGEMIGTGQVSPFSPQGNAIGNALGFPGFGPDAHIDYANDLLSLKAGRAVDFRTLSPEELERLVEQPWPDAEQISANAAAIEAGETTGAAQSQVTEANVRVVAVPNRGGPGGDDPCDFHRYEDRECPDGYPSHHIIQDMFIRIGGRMSLERPIGAPTLEDGSAICLESGKHGELHSRISAALSEMGPTANLFDLADLSANELKKILNDVGVNCDQEIDDLLESFKRGLGENGNQLLGRSSTRPGSAAENALRDNWAAPRNGGIVE